jgi:hypothetical protein
MVGALVYGWCWSLGPRSTWVLWGPRCCAARLEKAAQRDRSLEFRSAAPSRTRWSWSSAVVCCSAPRGAGVRRRGVLMISPGVRAAHESYSVVVIGALVCGWCGSSEVSSTGVLWGQRWCADDRPRVLLRESYSAIVVSAVVCCSAQRGRRRRPPWRSDDQPGGASCARAVHRGGGGCAGVRLALIAGSEEYVGVVVGAVVYCSPLRAGRAHPRDRPAVRSPS